MIKRFDIFICYRRDGADFLADNIKKYLQKRGYRTFIDYKDMNRGNYAIQIKNYIKNCKDFIVIVPSNGVEKFYNEDDWVRKEIRYALDFKKNIIPVFMKGFDTSVELPDDIKKFIYYSGVNDVDSEHFDQTIIKITKYMKSKPIILYTKLIIVIALMFILLYFNTIFQKSFDSNISNITIESSIYSELDKSTPEVSMDNFNGQTNIVNGGIGCYDGINYYFGNDFLLCKDMNGFENILYNNTAYYLNVVGDYIYFVAKYENNAICRIKKDGTEFEKIYTSYCHELTYYDGWLYFCSDMGTDDYFICRMKPDGSNFTVLANCLEWYMNIYEDKIFFCNCYDGNSIYSMNTDGSDYKLVYKGDCYDLCIVDSKLYFSADGDLRWLYSINTDGTNEVLISDSYTRCTNYQNNKLYFINSEEMICNCDLNGKNKYILYDDISYSFITLFPGKICSCDSNNKLIILDL